MISVDFSKVCGKIKPVHGVGNGPLGSLSVDKSAEFRAARIPFSRLHDTEGMYGGGVFVNIHCIFPNFDADVCDPNAYFFAATDIYIQAIIDAGTQVFYRLGESIEPSKLLKIYVRPPKDYLKWAQICEHIIMHYTQGWANGFYHKIEYWEIWNEPDNHNMWADATPEEYYELYYVTANYLKSRFPQLKIGGYSASGFYAYNREDASDWFKTLIPFMDGFFQYITRPEKKSPLDFFSWHCYTTDPKEISLHAGFVQEKLMEYGFSETESILTEWNYALDWNVEDVRKRKSIFGASMVAGSIIELEKSPAAAAMYYDAEIISYCGLFNEYTKAPEKPYYTLYYYGKLYDLGTEAESQSDEEDIYVLSAVRDGEGGIMLTNFSTETKTVEIILDREISLEQIRLYVTDGEVTNTEKINDLLALDHKKIVIKLSPYAVDYLEVKF